VHPLFFYNTLTRQHDLFTPIDMARITLYSCGPTVYATPHIGNLRAYVFADMLKRVLHDVGGYNVTHAINITDVGHLTSDGDTGDDKLEAQAKRNNETAWDIADRHTLEFKQALTDLNIIAPDHMPRATDYIDEQIALVQTLETKGFTYRTADGIYFDSQRFNAYAELARLDVNGLNAGQRVDQSDKRHVTDFALWKFSTQDAKRQMEWASPWGTGFPGWHLECSAMAMTLLGETIDLHTGGIDHIPIHHTNEIAQSECATGKRFVNYWLHSNFLTLYDGKTPIKMSKSLGNVITLDTLKKANFSGDELRYLFLLSHYRSEVVFNVDYTQLSSAKNGLRRLREKIKPIFARYPVQAGKQIPINDDIKQLAQIISKDLDTVGFMAQLQAFVNKTDHDETSAHTLYWVENLIGLSLSVVDTVFSDTVIALAEKRQLARQNKDWAASDTLRKALEDQGVRIKDQGNDYELTPI
jgi:cysteinyl-tRNA synthetase